MVLLVEGTTATVTPKGFTLLSLTTAGPKRQAPPCATVSPCGTSSLRDPDGFVAIPPILCSGPQVFVWVLGGRSPPECAHPSSPSQHMLDATTDDNLSTADIAMVTIDGCCWEDLCEGAEPAPAPQTADPHPRDCRYPLPSTSPISSTLYLTIPRSQLPNPSPSPHVCLQLHQLCLSFPSPVFATPGEGGVPSLGYFSLAKLRPRLQSWRDAERRLRRCGNPRRPSPGDRPGMLQRCSGGRARGTRAVGDVSIGMPPPTQTTAWIFVTRC